jgi:hypothetical protein
MHSVVDEFFDGALRLENVEMVVTDMAGVVEIGVRLEACMQASAVDGGIFPHGSFNVRFLTVLLVADIVRSDQVLSVPDEDWVVVCLTKIVAGPIRASVTLLQGARARRWQVGLVFA